MLTDPSTWKLKILGPQGQVVEVLTEAEAKAKYAGALGHPSLTAMLAATGQGGEGQDFTRSRVRWDTIDLTSGVPLPGAPLPKDELLRVLKKKAGLR